MVDGHVGDAAAALVLRIRRKTEILAAVRSGGAAERCERCRGRPMPAASASRGRPSPTATPAAPPVRTRAGQWAWVSPLR